MYHGSALDTKRLSELKQAPLQRYVRSGTRRGSQVVRSRSAKPLFAGSIPAPASFIGNVAKSSKLGKVPHKVPYNPAVLLCSKIRQVAVANDTRNRPVRSSQKKFRVTALTGSGKRQRGWPRQINFSILVAGS